jgi:HEAT repeat protein
MTPVLFQPIPSRMQPRVQSLVRGIAEPLSMGGAGLGFLLVIAAVRRFAPPEANLVQIQSQAFVLGIVVVALIWLGVIYLLRSRYLELLVVSAERGELSTAEGNIRSMRQAMIEALARPGNEADKGAYVDLLSSLDPYGASEVLASLLPMMSPALQQRSLKVMLEHPKTIHLETVRSLDQPETPPEVRALALRYAWLTEENPNVQTLLNQLTPDVNPVVRGTAAAIVLRQGNLNQRDTALMVVQNMLVSPQEQERIMGCQALADMGLVYPEFRSYIRGLLRDKSLAVRQEVLDAIATLRLQEYYPSLLRGLYYKSTREAATQALSHLGDEGIPMLVQLAEDPLKPEAVRFYAWSALGRMGTEAAMDALVLPLRTIWGNRRRTLLRAILRLPDDQGIEAVLDRLRRSGVELMLDQELMFLGQMIAAMQDLRAEKVNSQEAELLRRGLLDLQTDGIERLFLLMRFLYPAEAIQAAEFGILRSGSFDSMARGLEILDNTLDIPSKRALLEVLDQRPLLEKLHSLSDLIVYYPLAPSDRLRFLLDLRHFLSDWVAACCYHLACEQRWSLTPDQVLAGLRHPTGFVREAVLAYLEMASPRSLKGLLPHMSQDPDPLVMAQVRQLVSQYRE